MQRSNWHSTATLETLKKRADLLGQIRSFFMGRGCMEVDTPLLGDCGVTDLHIDCVVARVDGRVRYLQSSPEFFMKRLLAQGSGAIYYLGKVFRDGEVGARHRPEFTMLEWYRPDWDETRLMEEVRDLVCFVSGRAYPMVALSYGEIFNHVVGFDPHNAPLGALSDCAHKYSDGDWSGESRSTLLDLLFSLVVEPKLPAGLVFVHSYPSCQAALARLDRDSGGQQVARRFEVFFNRMELGNGYYELTDVAEQQSRFDTDNELRKAAGKKPMAVDGALLAALDSGLPDCAGVAIGVDRLLMQLLGKKEIAEVTPFG